MSATEVPLTIEDLVAQHAEGRESLIPILQDLQDRDGYLAEEAVQELASAMSISENEIFGVATFYTQFRFTPPAEHTICVCQGTACHVRGSHQILHDFEERLEIQAGQKTADGKFGLERVACVGCCALAPVVVVDGKVHAGVKPKNVRRMLKKIDGEKEA
jgi:NADH-quinone oxidoreductase subunit E